MTDREFEELGLVKGDSCKVFYRWNGEDTETEAVEFMTTRKSRKGNLLAGFATNNWAGEFYQLPVHRIKEVQRLN